MTRPSYGVTVEFAEALQVARRRRSLTQQQLADSAGVHVTMLNRYEAGLSEPGVRVLRQLAQALSVMTDELVFGETRQPRGTALALAFEAAATLQKADQAALCRVVEGLVARAEQQARPEGSRRHR
jgi:transcriptional regulator with XRE-family HTH domain